MRNCLQRAPGGLANTDNRLLPFAKPGCADDGSIWHFATSGNWTLITKDEDFVERCLDNPAAPAVIWLRIGNSTNRVPFAWLDPLLPEIIHLLESGQRLVEVRRDKPPGQ